MSHNRFKNHTGVRIFRYSILAGILAGLGSLFMCSPTRAFESDLDGVDLYQWHGIFDDSALMYRDNNNLDILDLHGVTIKVLVDSDFNCAMLIIDMPSIGPSIMPCVEKTTIGSSD